MNRRQIAALVGVAPLNRDSGKYKGRRTILGRQGKNPFRIITCVSSQAFVTNPKIKAFLKQVDQPLGRNTKLPITACMEGSL